MKVLVIVAVVNMMAALLIACGPSTSEVEKTVATAIAESEKRTEQKLRDEMKAEGVDVERRIEAASEKVFGGVESVAMALEDAHRQTIDSLCTTDYGKTSLISTVYWLLEHLKGSVEFSLDDVGVLLEGVVLNENYGELSGVCNVEDDQWVLQKLPSIKDYNR